MKSQYLSTSQVILFLNIDRSTRVGSSAEQRCLVTSPTGGVFQFPRQGMESEVIWTWRELLLG